MKTLIVYILLFSPFLVYSKPKYIEIITNIKKINKKSISIYTNRYSYLHDWKTSIDPDDITKNKIDLYWWEDTLILKLDKHIPIIIEGITKIASDTIRITELVFTEYIPIDSMATTSNVYNKRKKKYISTKKNSNPENFSKLKIVESGIRINDNFYKIEVDKEYYNVMITYCTPGKYRYKQKIVGTKVCYIVRL